MIIKALQLLGIKEKTKYGIWENVIVFEQSGYSYLIQKKSCELTNRMKFQKIKIAFTNDVFLSNKINNKIICQQKTHPI